MNDDSQQRIRPNGLSVRRLRHQRGWSPRELINASGEPSERATGIRTTITPNLLSGIEEKCEIIPYSTLYLIADGLDCDPVDLMDEDCAPDPKRRTP